MSKSSKVDKKIEEIAEEKTKKKLSFLVNNWEKLGKYIETYEEDKNFEGKE